MRPYLLFITSIILSVSCVNSSSEHIPFSSNIDLNIDGQFEYEWDKSRKITIDTFSVNSLYLMHDLENFYIGIKTGDSVKRYVDLYIEDDGESLVNYHASFQLGERLLSGYWNDTIPDWNWGNNYLWRANKVNMLTHDENVPFEQNLEPYSGFEFAFSKKKFQNGKIKIRLELKDFLGNAMDVIFPINAERRNSKNWLQIELK